MTDLEKAMESMIEVFNKYASEEGGSYMVSRKEFKKLVETELPNFLQAKQNPDIVKTMMQDLDDNGDDHLSFEEFCSLVVGLSMVCQKCYAALQANK